MNNTVYYKAAAAALILAVIFSLFSTASYALIAESDTVNYTEAAYMAASASYDDYEAIDRQLSEDIKNNHIPGMAVAVVDKDGVLFEKTYGNCADARQPFIIGSMSKSFTALAIMQLAEQGRLDINRPMDDYIDSSRWFADGTNHGRITVRDLLNQTSGITTYQAFGSLRSTESYGSHVYANANYGLLGLVIEAVSGMSYEEYITQNIFEPLGMDHSAASLKKSEENGLIAGYRNYFGVPVAGKPDYPVEISVGTWTNVPGGYLSASVTDMEKYLRMYLRGGEGIISAGSIDRMFYENVPADDGRYGMGWYYSTETFGQPVLAHSGLTENYASYMFILPEKGTAAVFLVNMNDYLVGNSLLGDMVMPFFGLEGRRQPHLYVLLHAAIDAAYLAIFTISLLSALTLKKWKTMAKKKRTHVYDVLRHIILPAVLLAVPTLTGTPFMAVWLFVKDLAVVLSANAAILIAAGIYKAVFLIRKTNGDKAL